MIWSKFHYFYGNLKRAIIAFKKCLKSIFNKDTFIAVLNALKIQKNTVIRSVASPLLGKLFRRV